MLHVVLDTNIFRHDPARKKIAFRALSKLAKSDFIKIYVPYVVYKEFVSQEINNYLEDIGNLSKGMRGLLKINLPEDIINLIENIDQKTDNIKKDIEAFVDYNFLQWIADNNAELIQIKNHHGQNVITAYFDGIHPFAKIKNREDFPDAFIWETICDLINEVDILYVISSDGGIIKACEPQDKIINFNNLEDFIKSGECHEELRDFYFENKFPEFISI